MDEKLAKECPVFGDCILCLAKFSIEMNKQILLLLLQPPLVSQNLSARC
jgi:hypothetical protein